MKDKVYKDGEVEAKLSERKTVHEWLNSLNISSEEFGKQICLLRRLRILCDKFVEYEDAFNQLWHYSDCTEGQMELINKVCPQTEDLVFKKV